MSDHKTSTYLALTVIFAMSALILPVSGGRAAQGTPASGGTAVSGANPCNIDLPGTPQMGTPDVVQPVASPVVAVPYDLLFLDLMSRQRERIATAALLAANHADHAELVEFGSVLAADAATDVTQLHDWRSAWYGDVPPLSDREIAASLDLLGRAHGSQAGLPGAFEILAMTNMVPDLCRADSPFDRTVLGVMTPALNAELLLARSALDLATHEQIRNMAQRLIDHDQPRIDALVAWRTAWYPGLATPLATPSR